MRKSMLVAALLVVVGLTPGLSPAQEKKEPDLLDRLKTIKGPFTLVVTLQVKKGEEKAFIDAAKPCVAATRKEKGCVRYELNQSVEDPTKFVMYERWESPQALADHLKADHTKKLLGMMGKIAAGAPSITLYKGTAE